MKKEKSIYEQAIDKWGIDRQLDIVVEECAELIQTIQKYRRDPTAFQNIICEKVDVDIMMRQLDVVFNKAKEWKDLYDNNEYYKLQRLQKKLDEIK